MFVINPKKAQGRVCKILKDFKKGDILVVADLVPDLLPLASQSSAIVSKNDSILCHAAVLAREFGITAYLGLEINAPHSAKVEIDERGKWQRIKS